MPSTLRQLPTALCLVLTLLLSACSHSHMIGNPEVPYPPPHPPEVGDILHLPTGTYVSEDAMLAAVSDARIVYVGETHDNPASHRQQEKVLRAMAERHPGRVALGMEMFTPAQQAVLDRWSAGDLGEKEFLKEVRWYDNWRMDFDYYQPLLKLAQEQRIPVVALNADKSLVKAVGRTPLTELSDAEREALPEMDLDDPYQKALVTAIFGDHAHGSAMLDGFHRIQTLWDETMAASVAAFLQEKGPEWRMVVVAGGNHVQSGFGIPRRVFRRLPTSYVIIGSKSIVIPEAKRAQLMNVEVPPFPMPPYDYLLHTVYEDLDKEEVKLGVMLGGEGKVEVLGVLPGSNGEKAGLQKGDILLQLDGEELQENFDLIYLVKQKAPGDRSTLLIEREGVEQTVEVIFEKLLDDLHHHPR